MRARVVALYSLSIAVVVGGALAAPFLVDAIRGQEAVPSPAIVVSPDVHRELFQFQRMLVESGREPLAWDCRADDVDRVRIHRDSCFAEHWADVTLPDASGRAAARLVASGDAVFLDPHGATLRGVHALSDSQAAGLRSLLEQRLPALPGNNGVWQMPYYSSSIEACLDGKSYFVQRGRFDADYQQLLGDVAGQAGVRLERTTPASCM